VNLKYFFIVSHVTFPFHRFTCNVSSLVKRTVTFQKKYGLLSNETGTEGNVQIDNYGKTHV